MLKMKSMLTKLAGRVNFGFETTNISTSVAGSSLASVLVPLPTTKKAIGLAGVALGGTGAANMAIWNFNMQSNGTRVEFTNLSTTARTITVYVEYITVDS